jgi:hypothetical protein
MKLQVLFLQFMYALVGILYEVQVQTFLKHLIQLI